MEALHVVSTDNTTMRGEVMFSELMVEDTMGLAGQPTGLAVTTDRASAVITLASPARAVVLNLENGMVMGGASLGSDGDIIHQPALALDGAKAYVTNSTANKLFKITVPMGMVMQTVTSSDAAAMAAAGPVSVTSTGLVLVGSTSTAQDTMLAFTDTSMLMHSAANSVQLMTDAPATGNAPGACAAVSGQSYLYCLSGGGSDGAGIWKITPGSAPVQVVAGLASPSAIAVSPDGKLLVVAAGTMVRAYNIDAMPDAPSLRSMTAPGGSVADIAFMPDSSSFWVSIPSANAITRISSDTIEVQSSITGIKAPGALEFVP